MVRIGITGHANLTDATAGLVAGELRRLLAGHAGLVGVTCLARGADQVFARTVLELGGTLEVVLPAADYRDREVEPDNAAEFDGLLAEAAVHTMPFAESGGAAYLAAGEHLLSIVDKLVAVWDGGPSGGLGGTADVVEAARKRGMDVTVVWPERAARG
ncbi:hypothetical protein [Amycolatopsis sp. NPDC021455]|uniref:hypothetical protein n=1 Tax=Amycolatopsis sp. NPDC021455 TaxID=3154901 RepID=UPI0033EB514D